MSKYGVLIAESSLEFRMAIKNTIQKSLPLELNSTVMKEEELYEKVCDKDVSLVILGDDFCIGRGLEVLANIAKQRRVPVVYVSNDYGQTAEAYELGAAVFLLKTHISEPIAMFEKRLKNALKQILPQIKEGGNCAAREKELKGIAVEPKHHPDELLSSKPSEYVGRKIVAIGASTGGVEALSKVLTKLPLGLAPIVVVQHMPLMFSKNFVSRLNLLCKVSVVEAKDGEILNDSTVYFGPGDSHLVVDRARQNGKYVAKIVDGVKISRHRPSIDILFRSVNNSAGGGAMAIVMTGMGDDGSIGIKELFDSNACTLAQSEASSVVYGMAQSAVKAGAIKKIVDLDEISSEIIAFCNNERNIIK
ncbi:MAG: chemotaxis protein CheB [Campylobacterales bacterium]|nr:chemotaxis protein CheB [Campylobacterales bacterium]